MAKIDTSENRLKLNKLKISLATIGIIVSSMAGLAGDYYLDPDIELYTESLTQYEYNQLKPILINKIKNRKVELINFLDGRLWVAMVRKELKECKTFEMQNANNDSIIDSLQTILEVGC